MAILSTCVASVWHNIPTWPHTAAAVQARGRIEFGLGAYTAIQGAKPAGAWPQGGARAGGLRREPGGAPLYASNRPILAIAPILVNRSRWVSLGIKADRQADR